jgi:GNAT superfamily N-acetyltransferase
MDLTIIEENPIRLAEYARVPIGFSVAEAFDEDAIATLLRGQPAVSTPVATPYWKNYDEHSNNHPTDWAKSFDLACWTIFAAYRRNQRVGGAIVIYGDPQMELLRDCRECGLIWDIRVQPEMRGEGIGTALLHAVENSALDKGARAFRVETQQINVPACRFYERNGFRLERATPGAYRDLPPEIQLLWRKPRQGGFEPLSSART